VGSKCRSSKSLFFPGSLRSALVDVLAASTPWLRCSRWESLQDEFVDFPEVVDKCAQVLSQLPELAAAGGATVFYACGQDHFERCNYSVVRMHQREPPAGVVCVPRAGKVSPCDPAKLMFLAEPPLGVADLSSTALRKALLSEGDLSSFVPPAAAAVLRGFAASQKAAIAGEGGGGSGGGGGGGGAPPAPLPPPRSVFISLSALLRDVKVNAVPPSELEAALFFFGSKRCWVWPATPEETAESLAQGAHYTSGMPPDFRALLIRKELRGEVLFLKPDTLGEPDVEVFGDYASASAWLAGLGYGALRLQRGWWEAFPGPLRYAPSGGSVADNFATGLHGYSQVMELLAQSCPLLTPVLQWPQ
jgi:hypothetical protein